MKFTRTLFFTENATGFAAYFTSVCVRGLLVVTGFYVETRANARQLYHHASRVPPSINTPDGTFERNRKLSPEELFAKPWRSK